jgi:uncharacterized protein (TIGR03437 family)
MAQTCTFTLTSKPQSFPLAGGTGTVTVTASSSSCVRNAVSTVDWITIVLGETGTGNGSIGFTVAPNSTVPSRTGTITVGAQSVDITQSGPPCNFAINPVSVNVSALGQSGTVALTGLSGCSWTVSSFSTWLQVTSAASGVGPATVAYTAESNPATVPRSATISIAGLTFTVNQAGVCSYTLTPSSGSFTAAGGTGTFQVGAGSGCAWTATSSAAWIHVTGTGAGSGAGQVAFSVDPDTGDARTGTILVGGQSFTLSQASQTCTFALSPATGPVPAGGGTAVFIVAAPPGCAWTAAASDTWITIVSGASGSGNGVVGISIPWNTGAARAGTVSLGDQSFPVSQPSGMLQPDSVANAASLVTGSVTPGMIVTITAPAGIGPANQVPQQLTPDGLSLTTQLGSAQVTFDGIAAPMVSAANGQFSAVVPYKVDGKSCTLMQLQYQGALSNQVKLPVVPSEPGLFSFDSSGTGPGLILDAMGNPNSSSNPAAAESVVTMFATGEGDTSAPGVDGLLATVPAPAPVLPVSVTIAGINATVVYYGGALGQVAGMMRIDVQIPDGAMSGPQPVVLQVGTAQSQPGITVAVQ